VSPCCKALKFYLQDHPQQLNDLLIVLTSRIDHSRVVDLMRKAGHLPLVKQYLSAVQNTNLNAVNDAVNELCIEAGAYTRSRYSST
jgi:clathrin heavy chain